MVDWAGLGLFVSSLGGATAAVIGALNRRTMRETEKKINTTNGATIGRLVEQQHDAAKETHEKVLLISSQLEGHYSRVETTYREFIKLLKEKQE